MDVKGIDNLKMQAQQYELSIKENYAAPVTRTAEANGSALGYAKKS